MITAMPGSYGRVDGFGFGEGFAVFADHLGDMIEGLAGGTSREFPWMFISPCALPFLGLGSLGWLQGGGDFHPFGWCEGFAEEVFRVFAADDAIEVDDGLCPSDRVKTSASYGVLVNSSTSSRTVVPPGINHCRQPPSTQPRVFGRLKSLPAPMLLCFLHCLS